MNNELSGVVQGSAVQAGSIHGGVHFSVTQAAPGLMPVPAQLPLAASHFTGRLEELAELDRVAAEYDPVRRLAIAVIVGVGGVGKTSLASHWLHRVSERYEGGALYADLRGAMPATAKPPSELLTGFLAALGTPPERIPLDLGEQAGLFRSATSGRRMLMLLDNAASAAQVRALLPGPGPSLVVVTTRWRITGLAMEGARFIELKPLEDTAATSLLGRIIGTDRAATDDDAVRSVVRLCGGLPLAMRIASAKLAAHPRWPISRLAAELASEQRRLTALTITGDLSVRAAFDVSYQALSADAAEMYRLLSLIPGPDFSQELVAATADAEPEQAAESLDALISASLLEETSEDRFRLHDLVRLHARERVSAEPADQRTAAITRAIGWHLTKAVAADIVIIPGRWRLNPMYEQARVAPHAFAESAEALEWMESELASLLDAIKTAHDEGLHEQAWQLCEAMWGLFSSRKYFRQWIEAHNVGVASAQTCGDRRAEARMRVQLGLAYLNLSQQERAREEFAQALTLARDEGHRIGEATALEQLGLVDLSLGRPDEAIDAFVHAREIFQQIGEPRGVLGLNRHIGDAHRAAGRHELAVRHLLEARRISAALPDRYNEARCLTSIGLAYLQVNQPDPAVRSFSEALGIMIRIGGRYEQARIHTALADALRMLGNTDQARDHLTDALAIYSEIGAPEAGEIRQRLS
jgi:tetratricopeptide (TPR) repeat protein